ncbi:MAG: CCA tRNA nucleotidyltransferase [Roseburia sp.]|nr:CCA tRNA nucleotidyltransferase [Roseburia sp.]
MGNCMRIPEKVGYILEKLKENHFEGYVVGGCVRDSILGRIPGDWDITTSAKPEEVKRIFRRTVDTGIEHGTVTVMIGEEGFEVTTYRVDGKYEDHRHPEKVEFTPNLEEDLKRRDFTINAMAYDPEQGLVDLFDGTGDIERKCIRCVGNPAERFLEDALRMLRGIRFAGQLGFDIEKDTLEAIRVCSATLVNVSAERIRVELTKLLLSKEPEKLRDAEKTGLCQIFLPEFSEMFRTEQRNPNHCYPVGEHCIHAVRHVQEISRKVLCSGQGEHALSPYGREFSEEKVNTILVFSALLHDVGKPACRTTDESGTDHFYGHDVKGSEMAHRILKRLRFDNDTVQTVTRIIRFHERRYDGNQRALRRFVSKAGADIMPYLFMLQEADILSQSGYNREEKLMRLAEAKRMFADIMEKQQPVCIKELAVTGRDILDLGVMPGPEVGQVLKKLLEIVIEEPEKNDRQLLLTEAEKHIKIKNKASGMDKYTR